MGAKHTSGTEWFRKIIIKDGSKMQSYFRKGRLFAFGNRYPLLRDQKLTDDLETKVKDKEHQRYFYAEQKK